MSWPGIGGCHVGDIWVRVSLIICIIIILSNFDAFCEWFC